MKRFPRFSYWVVGGMALLGFLPVAHAEIAPHRIHVILNITPRPTDGAPRKVDVLFDQKAFLKIKMTNLADPAPNVQICWTMLYDEVEVSGKIEQRNSSGAISASFAKGEEKSFESKTLRMTGKINKKGHLSGMKHLGYGVQVLENGRMIYETYQPQDLKKEAVDILGTSKTPLSNFSKSDPNIPSVQKSEPTPHEVAAMPVNETGVVSNVGAPKESNTATPQDKTVTLFECSFTAGETAKVLKAVNELSLEELDKKVGLTKKMAENIVAKRPFTTLDELEKVSYVKKAAFSALKEYISKK